MFLAGDFHAAGEIHSVEPSSTIFFSSLSKMRILILLGIYNTNECEKKTRQEVLEKVFFPVHSCRFFYVPYTREIDSCFLSNQVNYRYRKVLRYSSLIITVSVRHNVPKYKLDWWPSFFISRVILFFLKRKLNLVIFFCVIGNAAVLVEKKTLQIAVTSIFCTFKKWEMLAATKNFNNHDSIFIHSIKWIPNRSIFVFFSSSVK